MHNIFCRSFRQMHVLPQSRLFNCTCLNYMCEFSYELISFFLHSQYSSMVVVIIHSFSLLYSIPLRDYFRFNLSSWFSNAHLYRRGHSMFICYFCNYILVSKLCSMLILRFILSLTFFQYDQDNT